MKFIFETENLNERFYKRFIRTYVWFQLPRHIRRKYKNEIKNQRIIFRPSSMASEDPHFSGQDGVGGVTRMGEQIFYLEDKHESIYDSFQRVLRRNLKVITHENGHWFLIMAGRNEKVALRNDDYSGHKKGTMLNFSTAEVHDRDIEGVKVLMPFWFVDWKKFKIFRRDLRVLNYRDIFE